MTDLHDFRESKGVQAYRWIVLAGIAALGFMLTKVYEKIDKTADAVVTVERSVTALSGQIEAQSRQIADHARRIDRLETPYFRPPQERPTP